MEPTNHFHCFWSTGILREAEGEVDGQIIWWRKDAAEVADVDNTWKEVITLAMNRIECNEFFKALAILGNI